MKFCIIIQFWLDNFAYADEIWALNLVNWKIIWGNFTPICVANPIAQVTDYDGFSKKILALLTGPGRR